MRTLCTIGGVLILVGIASCLLFGLLESPRQDPTIPQGAAIQNAWLVGAHFASSELVVELDSGVRSTFDAGEGYVWAQLRFQAGGRFVWAVLGKGDRSGYNFAGAYRFNIDASETDLEKNLVFSREELVDVFGEGAVLYGIADASSSGEELIVNVGFFESGKMVPGAYLQSGTYRHHYSSNRFDRLVD